ncbi:ADP-ribosylglycohydrolase family protein [Pseudomonas aeruginosa]
MVCLDTIRTEEHVTTEDQYFQFLSATALGDSLGIPYEGVNGRRVRRMSKRLIRQRFILSRYGMVSDDTEHALLTARALVASGDDPTVFEAELASRLKRWLLALPPGIGKTTLYSIIRLWVVDPRKSGLRSAGNGPLMRAPVVGLYYRNSPHLRDQFVRASTWMTHADSRALFMSAGVADIVAGSAEASLDWPEMSLLFRAAAARHAEPGDKSYLEELHRLLDELDRAHKVNAKVPAALGAIGCSKGVDGYVYRSALAAAYIASHTRDALEAISLAILQGGDTDSTAALAGAISAANFKDVDIGGVRELMDWPVNTRLLRVYAQSLTRRAGDHIGDPCYWRQVLRNIAFLLLDMVSYTRRALPPY